MRKYCIFIIMIQTFIGLNGQPDYFDKVYAKIVQERFGNLNETKIFSSLSFFGCDSSGFLPLVRRDSVVFGSYYDNVLSCIRHIEMDSTTISIANFYSNLDDEIFKYEIISKSENWNLNFVKNDKRIIVYLNGFKIQTYNLISISDTSFFYPIFIVDNEEYNLDVNIGFGISKHEIALSFALCNGTETLFKIKLHVNFIEKNKNFNIESCRINSYGIGLTKYAMSIFYSDEIDSHYLILGNYLVESSERYFDILNDSISILDEKTEYFSDFTKSVAYYGVAVENFNCVEKSLVLIGPINNEIKIDRVLNKCEEIQVDFIDWEVPKNDFQFEYLIK